MNKMIILLFLFPAAVLSAGQPDINTSSAAAIRMVFRRHGWSQAAASRLLNLRERLGYFEDMDQLTLLRGIGRRLSEKMKVLFTVKKPAEIQIPLILRIRQYRGVTEEKYADSNTESRININIATAEKLASLPGIGTTLARQIIRNRQKCGIFRKRWELLRILQITPDLYALLRNRIRAGIPQKKPEWKISFRSGIENNRKRNPDCGMIMNLHLPDVFELKMLCRTMTNRCDFNETIRRLTIRGSLIAGCTAGGRWISFGDFRATFHPLVTGAFSMQEKITIAGQTGLFHLKPPGYGRHDQDTFGLCGMLQAGTCRLGGYFSSSSLKATLDGRTEATAQSDCSGGLSLTLFPSGTFNIHAGILLLRLNGGYSASALLYSGLYCRTQKSKAVLTVSAENNTDIKQTSIAASGTFLYRYHFLKFGIAFFCSGPDYKPLVVQYWGEKMLPGKGAAVQTAVKLSRKTGLEIKLAACRKYQSGTKSTEGRITHYCKPASGTMARLTWRYRCSTASDAENPAQHRITMYFSRSIVSAFSMHTALNIRRSADAGGKQLTLLFRFGEKQKISLRADCGNPASPKCPVYIPTPATGDWYTGGLFFRNRFRCLSLNLTLKTGRGFRTDLRLFHSSETGQERNSGLNLNMSMKL